MLLCCITNRPSHNIWARQQFSKLAKHWLLFHSWQTFVLKLGNTFIYSGTHYIFFIINQPSIHNRFLQLTISLTFENRMDGHYKRGNYSIGPNWEIAFLSLFSDSGFLSRTRYEFITFHWVSGKMNSSEFFGNICPNSSFLLCFFWHTLSERLF